MQEKRFVSLLYADISGFTSLTSSIGAEKMTDFINECFNTIDTIIHIHYGTVLRHEGDRVLAVFGFPRSYGNDSTNALRSALKIQKEIKKMGYNIDVHIGVGTGEILVSGEEIYGHLLDEVSHLEEIAEKGQILVSNDCYNINKDLFVFKECQEGFSLEKLKVHEDVPNYYITCHDDEFEDFKKVISIMPHIIIVKGEKGIGKSVFIEESIKRINHEKILNVYKTPPYGQEHLSFHLRFLETISQIVPEFTTLPSEENLQRRLFREIGGKILQKANEKPIIIVLKEGWFIDEITFRFFEIVGNMLERTRLVIIFELLQDTLPVEKVIRNSKANTTKIELKPLSQDIILQILSFYLKVYILTDSFKKEVVNLCLGNPSYAIEVCKLLKDKYPPGTELKEIPFSGHLKEIIQAVIDTIPVDYLTGLAMLSLFNNGIELQCCYHLIPKAEDFLNYCTGRGILYYKDSNLYFNSDLIQKSISGRLTKVVRQQYHKRIAEVLKILSKSAKDYGEIAYHLKEAGILDEACVFLNKRAEYLRKESLYEECLNAYDEILSLTPEEKSIVRFEILIKKIGLLHLIGERKQEISAIERLDEIAESLTDVGYRRRALIARTEYLEAIADYDGALKILQEINKEKEDPFILEKIGIIYYNKNETSQAMDYLNKALSLLVENNDHLLIGNVYKDIGLCYWKLGDKERALAYYKKAHSQYEKAGDEIALSRLKVNIGNVYFYLNSFDQSLLYYKEALDKAQKINEEIFIAQILSNMGSVYVQLGQYEEALRNFYAALEIDRKRFNPKGEAIRLSNIGDVYGVIGDLKKAEEFFVEALKIDERIGNTSGMAIRYGNLATCFMKGDNYEKAIEYLLKAVTISESIGLDEYQAFYYNLLGLACIKIDELNKAEDYLNKGLSKARSVKNPSYEIIAQSNLSLLHLQKGDLKKAFQYSNWAIENLMRIQEIEGEKERIYYIHYQILEKLNKVKEANHFLKLSYETVRAKVEKIVNLDFKKKFLNMPKNKEIIAQWERIEKQG